MVCITKYANIFTQSCYLFIVITYKYYIKPVVNLLIIYRCTAHSLKFLLFSSLTKFIFH